MREVFSYRESTGIAYPTLVLCPMQFTRLVELVSRRHKKAAGTGPMRRSVDQPGKDMLPQRI